MKKSYILCALFSAGVAGILGSCSDTWDDHYNETQEVVENTTISVVNQSITNYLENEPSVNSMYQLFQETGMIEKLKQKEKITVIFITHNIQEAISLGNRIMVMSKEGTIKEHLYNTIEKPVTPASEGYAKLWEHLNNQLT